MDCGMSRLERGRGGPWGIESSCHKGPFFQKSTDGPYLLLSVTKFPSNKAQDSGSKLNLGGLH